MLAIAANVALQRSGGAAPRQAAIAARTVSDGSKSTLLSTGLEFPTGLAVDWYGHRFYVSNFGVLPATGGPGGLSGQVDRVTLPSSWWSHPW